MAKPISSDNRWPACPLPHIRAHGGPLSCAVLMHAHLCRGYQLLAKMGGYKEGEGIGKSVKGRAAPIDVSLKSGRTGLGIDEERKRKKEDAKLQQTSRGARLSVCHLRCCWHRAWLLTTLGACIASCKAAASPRGVEVQLHQREGNILCRAPGGAPPIRGSQGAATF